MDSYWQKMRLERRRNSEKSTTHFLDGCVSTSSVDLRAQIHPTVAGGIYRTLRDDAAAHVANIAILKDCCAPTQGLVYNSQVAELGCFGAYSQTRGGCFYCYA